MEIPSFPLPSRPNIEITFRQPVMKETLKYCNPDVNGDEKRVSEYLNELQVGLLNDSRLWTAQDRRTALWWIMINSRVDNMEAFNYSCQHCGEMHVHDVDLSDLAETVELLAIEPYVTVNVPVNGVPTNWRLQPLDGRGQELLERMRALQPEPESPEYQAAMMRLRIAEFALCTALDDDPQDYEEAANRRFDIMESMAIESEFAPLVAHIQLMQKSLRHGLLMEFHQGEARVMLPPHNCGKEGMQLNTTQLFIPFQNGFFIPRFSANWLVNHH